MNAETETAPGVGSAEGRDSRAADTSTNVGQSTRTDAEYPEESPEEKQKRADARACLIYQKAAPGLDPEVRAILTDPETKEISPAANYQGNYRDRDASELPHPMPAPDMAEQIDSLEDMLAEKFDLTPGQAEGIAAWHRANNSDGEDRDELKIPAGLLEYFTNLMEAAIAGKVDPQIAAYVMRGSTQTARDLADALKKPLRTVQRHISLAKELRLEWLQSAPVSCNSAPPPLLI